MGIIPDYIIGKFIKFNCYKLHRTMDTMLTDCFNNVDNVEEKKNSYKMINLKADLSDFKINGFIVLNLKSGILYFSLLHNVAVDHCEV